MTMTAGLSSGKRWNCTKDSDLRTFVSPTCHAKNKENSNIFIKVVVLSENDLIRGARIRKLLGIQTGQTVENALRYRDKVLMKDILREGWVAVPECSPVESAADLITFTRLHGFPVVVKPRLGTSRSRDTLR